MSLTCRIVAIIAAALQLTLPLAAYARTAAVPGGGDVCSVGRAARHDPGRAPAGPHAKHCLLCAHGAPPALPAAPCVPSMQASTGIEVVAMATLAAPQPPRHRANARAPPRALLLLS
ncbi:MAG: DUF2946 family protein [Betaproteobacteria bacterium]